MKIRLSHLCVAVGLLVSQVTSAQSAPGGLASVTGAPFSGVLTQQNSRMFFDGNRVDRGGSVRLFRDSQGRTRVERELPAQVVAANPRLEPVQITINDPVSGERIELSPRSKSSVVIKGGAPRATPVRAEASAVFVTFGGKLYPATDPGWSAQVSLGEKSMDGIRAIGARRQYTLSVGTVGNEKPIVLTVEQWFSPELGLVLSKTSHASTGGDFEFQVENIVRGEPDPALFTIPPDYQRVDVGPNSAGNH